jgi:hypothetical protein
MKSLLWCWVIIGCLAGFFFIHPAVMVVSHLMKQSGTEVGSAVNNVIPAPDTLPTGCKMSLTDLSVTVMLYHC